MIVICFLQAENSNLFQTQMISVCIWLFSVDSINSKCLATYSPGDCEEKEIRGLQTKLLKGGW